MSEKKKIVEIQSAYLQSDRGEPVFYDLSFSLDPGRSAVIVGGAGSGKSSLVELILGVRKPDSGAVWLFGEKISAGRRGIIRKCRRRIGGVGGIFSLIPSITVAENIVYPLILTGESKKVIKNRLLTMLTEFSLLKQAGEYPGRLTRVESALVQFARASIADQPLLIIDEPAAGLDPQTFERMSDFFTKASLSGRSLLIVASEPLPGNLPNTTTFQLTNGSIV